MVIHQSFEVLPNELIAEICVHWANTDEDAAWMVAVDQSSLILSSPACMLVELMEFLAHYLSGCRGQERSQFVCR